MSNKAKQQESKAEGEAKRIIREYRPLLPGAGVGTLQKIVVEGAGVDQELTPELLSAADELSSALNAVASAVRNKATSPKVTASREAAAARKRKVYDRINGTLDDLQDFMDEVRPQLQNAYARELGESIQVEGCDTNVEGNKVTFNRAPEPDEAPDAPYVPETTAGRIAKDGKQKLLGFLGRRRG